VSCLPARHCCSQTETDEASPGPSRCILRLLEHIGLTGIPYPEPRAEMLKAFAHETDRLNEIFLSNTIMLEDSGGLEGCDIMGLHQSLLQLNQYLHSLPAKVAQVGA